MTYTQPLTALFLALAMLGLVRVRSSKRLLFTGIAGLFLISWPPVDWLASSWLEAGYREFRPAPVQAIVVLSSYVEPPRGSRPYPLPDRDTFQRCEFAAWLHKNWKPLPVLACLGRQMYGHPNAMRKLLERAGVAPAMIWTEELSRNTHENAAYGAEVLRAHGVSRIALVVEAQSMKRAAACFRKQGIEVVPAPCQYRELDRWYTELLPGWKTIHRNETTLHEAVGMVWYRLRGWV